VLVQRIHPRADDFEIFEFFSQCGKVRDIRLIRDQRSNKSKGVGYVEFENPQSVMNALALNGIAFKGQPLLVQASMAEKNRLAQQAKNVAAASAMMGGAAEPPALNKLIVSELHHNFTADDVREVFSPFGEIASIQLPNLGIAHIVFVMPEEASTSSVHPVQGDLSSSHGPGVHESIEGLNGRPTAAQYSVMRPSGSSSRSSASMMTTGRQPFCCST
jgi:hypothetical protein